MSFPCDIHGEGIYGEGIYGEGVEGIYICREGAIIEWL
jgi:hypothetical protein